MDIYLRETIMKYLDTQDINNFVLASAEKRKKFRRFCDTHILKDKLQCKGMSGVEPRVIPTPQQVEDCLFGRHVGPLGRHLMDRQTLVKALSNAWYRYTKGLGGARSASGQVSQKLCELHVRHQERITGFSKNVKTFFPGSQDLGKNITSVRELSSVRHSTTPVSVKRLDTRGQAR